MKTKNYIIEMFISSDESVCYIVRELSAPNVPPVSVAVCQSTEELADFFNESANM